MWMFKLIIENCLKCSKIISDLIFIKINNIKVILKSCWSIIYIFYYYSSN